MDEQKREVLWIKDKDELKKYRNEYSELVKLNQRLKWISTCYYIHVDGLVYMKSSLPEITEVYGLLVDTTKIEDFLGCMILPDAFFQFTKVAKKTKMNIAIVKTDDDEFFVLEDENDPSIHFEIHRVNLHMSNEYAEKAILPQMYKWSFHIGTSKDTDSIPYSTEQHLVLSEEDIDRLLDAKSFTLEFDGSMGITITREIFLDLKKGDSVEVVQWRYIPLGEEGIRAFYRVFHHTEFYTTTILFSALQHHAT